MQPELKINTEEALAAFTTDVATGIHHVLLQFGSEACTRCPAFHKAVAELKTTHNFIWAYCDAHDEDTDLVELFGITKLPALVLYSPEKRDQPLVIANASPVELQDAVKTRCMPCLQLDEDF